MTWSLYYVTTTDEFECDFVLARDIWESKRVFSEVYGGVRSRSRLVMDLPKSIKIREPMWLGPDPDLTRFGGRRMPSTAFPKWQFGARVFGCEITPKKRYEK